MSAINHLANSRGGLGRLLAGARELGLPRHADADRGAVGRDGDVEVAAAGCAQAQAVCGRRRADREEDRMGQRAHPDARCVDHQPAPVVRKAPRLDPRTGDVDRGGRLHRIEVKGGDAHRVSLGRGSHRTSEGFQKKTGLTVCKFGTMMQG